MKEKEPMAKCVQYAEEGILGAQYTLNGWFVKIKPLFSMDGKNKFAKNKPSVIFSFVQKGTQGSGFDIYMDIDIFDNWADDVLDVTKTFKKVIEAEKAAGEKYPKAYLYKTGDNGQKSVGFCPSTVTGAFCTVNGSTVSDNGKKVYANIPVDYDWMRTVCKKFKRITKPYFEMMAKVTYENSLVNYKREEQEAAPVPASNQTETAPKRQSEPIDDPNLKTIEIQTTDLLKSYGTKGNYWVPAADIKNKTYNFVFKKDDMECVAIWQAFKASAEKGRVRVILKYLQIETACYVKDILRADK